MEVEAACAFDVKDASKKTASCEAGIRRDENRASNGGRPASNGKRIHGRVEKDTPTSHHETSRGEAGQ